MRYEFRPDPRHKGRNQFIGSWKESPCRWIDLPFSRKSLEQVLTWGAMPDGSPHTHQEIAHWCDRMHMSLLDADGGPGAGREVDVAADVDCQWDLFLINTYKLDELRTLDFSSVRLPVEWFADWLKELTGSTHQGAEGDAADSVP